MATKSPVVAWTELEAVCNTFTNNETTLQCIHALPSGRICRKQLSSDRLQRLIVLCHRVQNFNDFWLSTTKVDLKHLVQDLHCSVHHDHLHYHDLYLACHKHLFSQQQQAWDLAKSNWHRYDRRWLDLATEVEAKRSPEAWAVYFYGLNTEDIQKKIPWPTSLEGHVPKLSSGGVMEFFTRSMASIKFSVDITNTKAGEDLEFAIDFVRNERSRWRALIDVYGDRDGVREEAENDVIALALSNVVRAMEVMLEGYERRLDMARNACEGALVALRLFRARQGGS